MMNTEKGITGPINLGNPHEFSLLELAETVKSLLSSNVPLVFKPLPQDDPTKRRPDISCALKQLNWQPHIDLKTGLERTITYFASRAL